VNTVINLWIPEESRVFSDSWVTTRFSNNILYHGVIN
jgi:hypothetical protein